jgi:Tfp pilus assembly protein PilO
MRQLGAWKKRIRMAILALVAANATVLWLNWQIVGASPQAQKEQWDRLREQHAAFGVAVERAERIRSDLGRVEQDCEEFLAGRLLGEESGYSVIVADLGEIARKAGLATRTVSYRPEELAKRNVMEVQVNATVEGSYPSIVRFINGLERSEHFYLMEGLTLASSQGGELRLNLKLRTYFRLRRS